MPKSNSKIVNLDDYFNQLDIQEETKNFVKNWKSSNYEDEIGDERKTNALGKQEISNER